MDVLSIYGAALATIVAVIQWRTRRTRLKLRVNPGRATASHRSDGGGGRIAVEGDVVFMRITNRSEHPVKITMVGGQTLRNRLLRLLLRRRSQAFVIVRPFPLSLVVPFVVEPRDNVLIWFKRDTLDGDRRTVFAAYTADDRAKYSRPITLSREPELAIGPK